MNHFTTQLLFLFFSIISHTIFIYSISLTTHKRRGEVRSKNGLDTTAEVHVSNSCKAIFYVTQISFRLVMWRFLFILTYFSFSILVFIYCHFKNNYIYIFYFVQNCVFFICDVTHYVTCDATHDLTSILNVINSGPIQLLSMLKTTAYPFPLFSWRN